MTWFGTYSHLLVPELYGNAKGSYVEPDPNKCPNIDGMHSLLFTDTSIDFTYNSIYRCASLGIMPDMRYGIHVRLSFLTEDDLVEVED